MGLFSRKAKAKPTITVNGIVVTVDPKYGMWEFTYQKQKFATYGPHLQMPTSDELENMLADLAALKPEMIRRLEKGWSSWDDVKMNDGETCSINLDSLSGAGGYDVAWADGATWGDMWIVFHVKDHRIVDESWGD